MLQVHDPGGDGDGMLRHHERLAVAVVEAVRQVAGQLEMLALVVTHRHLLGVVEQDVGRLQRGIGEQSRRHEVGLIGLLLELRHPPQPAERRGAPITQLSSACSATWLCTNSVHLGVETRRHQDLRDLDDLGAQHRRVLGDRESVEVDDAVDGVVLVLCPHPPPDPPR